MKTTTRPFLLPALAALALAHPGCAPPPEATTPAATATASAVGSGVIAFTNVTVLPMDRERTLERHTVLVRDGRIEALGPAASVRAPAGAMVIDGTGRYLLPGIAEMHAHVPGAQAGPALMEQIMFLYLANGITTIRGMLGAPIQLEVRDRIARGELLGPDFIVGAPSLNGNSAPDVETARRLVHEHQAAGYDFLKLHPGLSRPVYDAIVESARAVGITWAGHVSAGVGIEHTLATGQSTVDHLDGYVAGVANDAVRAALEAGQVSGLQLLRGTDPDRVRALAAATRDAGVWNVPTMYLWENFATATAPEVLVQAPDMRYATAQQRAGWLQQKRNMLQQQTQAGMTEEERQLSVQRRREILRALAEAGAPILLGSDAPQMFNVPGFSIHPEMRVMYESGMTPYQILESGTRNVARYAAQDLGLDGRFGTVAAGNRANLILLNGNPLTDLAHMRDPAGVMVRGSWLSGEEIRRRLDAIAAANADPSP
jgi:imidazolonepropionase-like amidohydrolase